MTETEVPTKPQFVQDLEDRKIYIWDLGRKRFKEAMRYYRDYLPHCPKKDSLYVTFSFPIDDDGDIYTKSYHRFVNECHYEIASGEINDCCHGDIQNWLYTWWPLTCMKEEDDEYPGLCRHCKVENCGCSEDYDVCACEDMDVYPNDVPEQTFYTWDSRPKVPSYVWEDWHHMDYRKYLAEED